MNNFREISSLLKLLDNEESCKTLHRLNWVSEAELATIREIMVVAEDVYPDRWDIQLRIVDDREPIVYVTILFPEIHIINSLKHEHTIHDIYVAIPLYKNHYGGIDYLLGTRTKASYGEYLSSYRHSHLESGYYDSLKFTPFCLGDGEIAQTILLYASTRDMAFFKLLLIQLEAYLSWESLEGGPHMKMASVFARGNSSNISTLSADDLRNISSRFMANRDLSSIDLQLSSDGYITIIDNEAFEEFARKTGSYSPEYLCYKDSDGNYCGTVRDVRRLNSLTTATVAFRDQNIPFTLDFTIPDNNGIQYLHPQLKKYLKNKFEYELNKRKIKATAFK